MTRPRYRKSRKDYPDGVLAVYDAGERVCDRYTVVYTPYALDEEDGIFPYVGMSGEPCHPQGFGQYGELSFRYTRGRGEKVIAFDALPADCQALVRRDLEEWTDGD